MAYHQETSAISAYSAPPRETEVVILTG